ncbi:DnaJ family domain-containing protein [Microbacterium xylanilyticum]
MVDEQQRRRSHAERLLGRGAGEATPPPSTLNAETMPAIVETAIQVAMRQGKFDDLPGAGKPIPGLGDHHDPDWWIRRKIERENLTGLGPPALMLRVEDRELEAQLDSLHREADVRAVLEDFNRRVIEARRQLLGGPPVVTKPRDVVAEVDAWRERRDAAATNEPAAAAEPKKRWFRRG